MNPLSLLGITGTVGSIAAVVGLLATLGAGAAVIVHEHDAKLKAADAAAVAVATLNEKQAESDRIIGGLTTANNTAINRLNALSSLKETIHAAAKSNACSSSPAVRALIGGLRGANGGSAGAKATPSTPGVAVPRTTAAAR